MTVIPTGHSLVTLTHDVPAGAGTRQAVITFGVSAEPSTGDASAIYQAWNNNVWSLFGSNMSVLTGCTMRSMLYVEEHSQNAVGGSTQEPDSPQVSLLVRKSTGRAGRRFRGRMYPPSQVYTATYNAGGTMTGGTLGEYQEGYDDFLLALTANDTPMVLLHNDATPPTDVVQLIVDNRVATQRRRTGR